MFTMIWDDRAFDQMHAIILWNPHRRPELSAALRTMTDALTQRADTWGESRDPPFRLAFIDDLSILFSVDMDDEVATVLEVNLRPTRDPG